MNRILHTNLAGNENVELHKLLKVQAGNLRREIFLPNYQRDYAWTDNDTNQLFEDILEHYQDKSSYKYFFGNLIFVQDENASPTKNYVLDGQQRLITFYIFVSCCVESLIKLNKDINESQDSVLNKDAWNDEINREIKRLKEHILKEDGEPFLKLIYHSDKVHFNHLLKNDEPFNNQPRGTNKKHRIFKAAINFNTKIDEYLDKIIDSNTEIQFRNKFKAISALSDYFVSESAEVTFTILNSGQEFMIFETLNNRGKNLNSYELTRNIFLNGAMKIDSIQETNVEDVFDNEIKENCSGDDNVFKANNATKLIIDCYNMYNENKYTASKYMYQFQNDVKKPSSYIESIEEHIERARQISNAPSNQNQDIKNINLGGFWRNGTHQEGNFNFYLQRLRNCSYSFKELIKPEKITEEANFQRDTQSIKKKLMGLIKLFNRTNFKQFYSLYFALRFRDFKAELLIRYVELVEKIYVNLIFTYEKSPSSIENILSKFAYEVYKCPLDEIDNLFLEHENKIKEMVKDIDSTVTLEDNFKNNFSKRNASNSQANYLLRKICIQVEPQSTDILSADIEVEHVMPISRNNWDNIDDESYYNNIERLGNKTLLTQEWNKELSNNTYQVKKELYREENLKITNGNYEFSVLNYEEWTSESINNRQISLAAIGFEIWGFEDDEKS